MTLTHVWVVYNSPTDIHLFDQREHILPSVKITYCNIPSTTFKVLPNTGMDVRVEIIRGGEMLSEYVEARCIPVWDEPLHL